MGNSIFRRFYCKELHILIIGIDTTTNLEKPLTPFCVQLREIVTSIPETGFNVESMVYQTKSTNVWDAGGRQSIRPLYIRDYQNIQGIIYMADCSDTARLDLTLYYLLPGDDLSGVPLLVLPDNVDKPGAVSSKQLASKIETVDYLCQRPWKVYDKNNDDLIETFDWFITSILTNEKQKMAESWSGGQHQLSDLHKQKSDTNQLVIKNKTPFLQSIVESMKKLVRNS
ncbi:hypothetical protein ACF0H5_009924 [Mactra antiquata]